MTVITGPTEPLLDAIAYARYHGDHAAAVVNEMIERALAEQRLADVSHLWAVWRLLIDG